MAKINKIVINSGYGFFGLRANDRDGIEITSKEESNDLYYLFQEKLKAVNEIGNYKVIRALKDLDVKEFNVVIASAITDYARCKLYELMHDVERKGGFIYYCDTDSIMTSFAIEHDEELNEKYMAKDDLGFLKNEFQEAVVKEYIKQFTKKEIKNWKNPGKNPTEKLVLLRKQEASLRPEAKKYAKEQCKNLDYYYNEAVFCGAKFYYLGRQIDDIAIEERKLKGYNKRDGPPTREQFIKCINDEVIEQPIRQFKASKGAMLEDDPMKSYLFAPDQTKKFRVNYTKGYTPGGRGVTKPYTIVSEKFEYIDPTLDALLDEVGFQTPPPQVAEKRDPMEIEDD